ncbi:MAG: adenylosuccinate lyase [Verrucomicrobiota bacterium]|nr:adenylosuccinate lyase [Verrucomicrobiota bacterium]
MSKCARHEEYVSPFSARYCSSEMSHLFSASFKITTFRKLWIALAKAQQSLGLPISRKQISQMESKIKAIDFEKTEEYEKKFRHDVMAHIHAFGDACPDAKPIIHLGATSSFVTDNGDLIQMREGLSLLLQKLLLVLQRFSKLAEKHAAAPCLSYTHFQPAQPTTIGKRICLWLQDFLLDAKEWQRCLEELPFLGVKGATGTQASFLALFEGSHSKVTALEKKIAKTFGFEKILPIAGQTYTRKIDLQLLNAFESFAVSAHKFATDVRLLAHEGEILEAFGESQVGSSAMPYKRNPIYCERICGIARFAISLAQNPAYTAATQWLERSLDDSSNRRLCIPEAFLSIDAILNLVLHVLDGIKIETKTALSRLDEQLPFLVMENILMEAVKRGANRQEVHEKLRKIAHSPDPMNALFRSKEFPLSFQEMKALAHPKGLIGRSPEQVNEFLTQELRPFLKRQRVRKISLSRVEF